MGSWFSSMFQNLAFLFEEDSQNRFLMLGLDNAGKTTLLYALKLGEVVTTAPTIGFNMEEISIGNNLTVSVWDIGGQSKLRQLWKHYYLGTVAIILVVDSNDHERLPEVRSELERMCSDPDLQDFFLLVMANKQDLPDAVSPAELSQTLGCAQLKGPRAWHVQGCSALQQEGIREGFQWLADRVTEAKRKK